MFVKAMAEDRVEEAYRRLHPRLWHALFSYTASRELASEAEAEAFAQAIRRGDGIRNVDAWVWRSAFKIAAGLMADAGSQTVTMVPDEREVVVVESPTIDFLAQLQGLSPQQRMIVVLRYIGLFTPTEIADLIDSSAGSVRVQLHRAHAHLRQRMEAPDGR